jgi:SAM-dependent methyltransferase
MAEHPAKFTAAIVDVMTDIVYSEWMHHDCAPIKVLDPFAGTGKIHELYSAAVLTFGVEIEPEWAFMHPRTLVGNALELPVRTCSIDVICTSPTYGNRMADHHEAKDDSKRMTYRHRLGRPLHPSNSGQLGWGPKYWEFHKAAWREQTRVLRPGGLFVLNVKNFYRTKTVKGTRVTEEVDVCQWHLDELTSLGYRVEASVAVPVRGMRMGTNHTRRVNHEMVYALRRQERR